MTLGIDTLNQIESLARLYHIGYRSAMIEATIPKLVMIERTQMEREVASLEDHLHSFEEQYNLSSEEFYKRFRAGEMGDDADWFDWSAFYQMWLSTRQRLQTLDQNCPHPSSYPRR